MKKRNNPEYLLQAQIVEYIRKAYPSVLLCASIAGAVRMSIPQWVRAKKAGYSTGFPDLFLYFPTNGLHGMAIECKAERDSRTPAQKDWCYRLVQYGYFAVTVWDMDMAVKYIDGYMRGAV